MKKVRVLTVFGTRPEGIKLAPVVFELNKVAKIEHAVCVTAQHRQMLDQVLDFFRIVPEFDLNIMRPGQDLTDVTSLVLNGLRDLFRKTYRPDWLIVHGDTTTCMTAALAGFYAGIKVAHVEAGLRTGNLKAPFPEEANRIITDQLADVLFAPTLSSRANLIHEGVQESKIVVTGNTVIDALNYSIDRIRDFSDQVSSLTKEVYNSGCPVILVTGHRRENFGDGFREICEGIRRLAQACPRIFIHYPVHLNPNVQAPVNDLLNSTPNVILDKPMPYPDFVYAMKQCSCILTDSGGVQEEGVALGKKVFVMRDATERSEGLSVDFLEIVGANNNKIFHSIKNFLDHRKVGGRLEGNPFGDGKAAARIVEYIANH